MVEYLAGNRIIGTDAERTALSSGYSSTRSLTGSYAYGTSQITGGNVVSVTLGDSGTKMYLASNNTSDNQSVYQYTLSTAYDVSTASYASKSFNNPFYNDVRGMSWKSDGTSWLRGSDEGVGGGANKRLIQFNPSTAWDISTSGSLAYSFTVSSYQSGVKDAIWGNSGNQVTSLSDNATLNTYDLSTAYQVSSASNTAKDQSLSSIDNSPVSHAWNSNGTKCFYLGSQNDKVYQLDCSTAWDITSMTHTASNDIDVSGQTTSPYGVWVSDEVNPVNIYIGGQTSPYSIYQYGLEASYNIEDGSIFYAKDTNKKYVLSSNTWTEL
tara:strand:- start:30 stop:1001 length:972 start_codon:yes stop_codon:yes gene_type:complete